MFPFLAPSLTKIWGPFRLFGSHLTLIFLSTAVSALLLIFFFPKLWHFLPHDKGKAFVQKSEEAAGKPTGGGLIIVLSFIFSLLLFMPFSLQLWGTVLCLTLCMLTGFLDDCSGSHWSETKKGFWDFAISLLVVLVMTWGTEPRIWVPIFRSAASDGTYLLPYPLYVFITTFILWVTINVVNCSDGVDGLAGSLSLIGLFGLGIFLYAIIGHSTISNYLLLPHQKDGAKWAILTFTAAGTLSGYLWHNAKPSAVMMGDAGSRFIGLLIGISSIAAGNPFLVLAAIPMLYIDGGIGLGKLIIFRLLKRCNVDVRPLLANVVNPKHPENFANEEAAAKQIWIVKTLHKLRCPLHDHCRKNLKWSDTQVLVRFMLMQILLMTALFLIAIKLR